MVSPRARRGLVLVAQHCWSSWCWCRLVLEQLVLGQLVLGWCWLVLGHLTAAEDAWQLTGRTWRGCWMMLGHLTAAGSGPSRQRAPRLQRQRQQVVRVEELVLVEQLVHLGHLLFQLVHLGPPVEQLVLVAVQD